MVHPRSKDIFILYINIRTTSVKYSTISESETEKRSPARDRSLFDNTFVNNSCIFPDVS